MWISAPEQGSLGWSLPQWGDTFDGRTPAPGTYPITSGGFLAGFLNQQQYNKLPIYVYIYIHIGLIEYELIGWSRSN